MTVIWKKINHSNHCPAETNVSANAKQLNKVDLG